MDAPIANITVKQEQETHQWVGAGQLYQSTAEADWAVPQEIKREIFGSFTTKSLKTLSICSQMKHHPRFMK